MTLNKDEEQQFFELFEKASLLQRLNFVATLQEKTDKIQCKLTRW